MEQGRAIPPPKPSPFDIPKCCPRSAFPLARREKEGRLRSRAELFVLTDQLTRADVRPAQGGCGGESWPRAPAGRPRLEQAPRECHWVGRP